MNPLNFLAATFLYRISLVGCVSYVLRAMWIESVLANRHDLNAYTPSCHVLLYC